MLKKCIAVNVNNQLKLFDSDNYDELCTYKPFGERSKVAVHDITYSSNKHGLMAIVPEKNDKLGVQVSLYSSSVNKICNIDEIQNPLCATFYNKSKYIVNIATAKGELYKYDIKNRYIIKQFETLPSPVQHLDNNENDTHLAAACTHGPILIHSIVNEVKSNSLLIRKNVPATCVKFHKNHRNFISAASRSGDVVVWDINTSKKILRLPRAPHNAPCFSIQAVSPASISTVGFDMKFFVYDINQSKVVSQKTFDEPLACHDVHDNKVVLGTLNGHVCVFDLRKMDIIERFASDAKRGEVKNVRFFSYMDKENTSLTVDANANVSVAEEVDEKRKKFKFGNSFMDFSAADSDGDPFGDDSVSETGNDSFMPFNTSDKDKKKFDLIVDSPLPSNFSKNTHITVSTPLTESLKRDSIAPSPIANENGAKIDVVSSQLIATNNLIVPQLKTMEEMIGRMNESMEKLSEKLLDMEKRLCNTEEMVLGNRSLQVTYWCNTMAKLDELFEQMHCDGQKTRQFQEELGRFF